VRVLSYFHYFQGVYIPPESSESESTLDPLSFARSIRPRPASPYSYEEMLDPEKKGTLCRRRAASCRGVVYVRLESWSGLTRRNGWVGLGSPSPVCGMPTPGDGTPLLRSLCTDAVFVGGRYAPPGTVVRAGAAKGVSCTDGLRSTCSEGRPRRDLKRAVRRLRVSFPGFGARSRLSPTPTSTPLVKLPIVKILSRGRLLKRLSRDTSLLCKHLSVSIS
jgi:hypothetical protein